MGFFQCWTNLKEFFLWLPPHERVNSSLSKGNNLHVLILTRPDSVAPVSHWFKVFLGSILIKSILNQYVKKNNQSIYLEKCKSLHFHSHLFVIFACVCLRVYVHKLLLCRNAVYEPTADHWGSVSKLAGGQMASPSPRRTVGVRRGHEEAGKKALSHAAQKEWIRPLCRAGWLTDWCLDPSQPWKWLESKPLLERHSTCVYLTGVCADEPTHSLSQESHMHKHTDMQTHAHHERSFSVWWSFWNVKMVHYANDFSPIQQILIVVFIQSQNNERWTCVDFG